MIGKPRPRPNPHKKPVKKPAAKKPAAPKSEVQRADAQAMGTYSKKQAAWKKAYDKKIAAIKAGKGTAAQKAKAIAQFKAAAAKNKPVKPTMSGELAAEYGWAHAVLMSDPSLRKLFADAVNGQWAPERFTAQLRSTPWYQQHSETWRNMETLRLSDPTSYAEKQAGMRARLKSTALEIGAQLDETELNELTTIATNGDWNESQIKSYVAAKLDLTTNGGLFGLAGKAEDELRQTASDLGVSYPDSWFQDQARKVIAEQGSIEEFQDQLRELSAQTYAGWGDRIRKGEKVTDMVAPYKQAMSRVLEIPENELSLTDPTLRKAITGSAAPEGQDPSISPLWKFEQGLRADPRWQSTKNAQNTAAQSGADILKQWGLMK